MWDNTQVIRLLNEILTELGQIQTKQDEIYTLLQSSLPDPEVTTTCLIIITVFSVLSFFMKKRFAS